MIYDWASESIISLFLKVNTISLTTTLQKFPAILSAIRLRVSGFSSSLPTLVQIRRSEKSTSEERGQTWLFIRSRRLLKIRMPNYFPKSSSLPDCHLLSLSAFQNPVLDLTILETCPWRERREKTTHVDHMSHVLETWDRCWPGSHIT